jgi:hypothetical protein
LSKSKNSKLFALTILASLLLLAVANVSMTGVKAAGTATVIMFDTIGGTTTPDSPGTTTYSDGSTVTFTATPQVGDVNTPGYYFFEWVIVTDAGSSVVFDNPLSFPVTGGTTYNVQAQFTPIANPAGLEPVPPAQLSSAAIVVVLSSAGGTTSPTPGSYALNSASALQLTATPASGWQFDHWVISGPNLSHGGYPFTATPTENPYSVNHGYGSTFSYQAVFTPVGSTVATPTPSSAGTGTIGASMTDTIIIVALVVVIVIVLIAFGAYAMRKKK